MENFFLQVFAPDPHKGSAPGPHGEISIPRPPVLSTTSKFLATPWIQFYVYQSKTTSGKNSSCKSKTVQRLTILTALFARLIVTLIAWQSHFDAYLFCHQTTNVLMMRKVKMLDINCIRVNKPCQNQIKKLSTVHFKIFCIDILYC